MSEQNKLCQVGDFAGRHWGDVVGLALIGTGVSLKVVSWITLLVMFAKGFDADKLVHLSLGVTALSDSLVMTGVGIVKLRHNPAPQNGNGNGTPKP